MIPWAKFAPQRLYFGVKLLPSSPQIRIFPSHERRRSVNCCSCQQVLLQNIFFQHPDCQHSTLFSTSRLSTFNTFSTSRLSTINTFSTSRLSTFNTSNYSQKCPFLVYSFSNKYFEQYFEGRMSRILPGKRKERGGGQIVKRGLSEGGGAVQHTKNQWWAGTRHVRPSVCPSACPSVRHSIYHLIYPHWRPPPLSPKSPDPPPPQPRTLFRT